MFTSHERERELISSIVKTSYVDPKQVNKTGVGVNEGLFTLSITKSSYMDLKWVNGAQLWDKCYCHLP